MGCSPGLGGDDDDLALAVVGRIDVVPGDDGSASFHGDGVLLELTGGGETVLIDSMSCDKIERHATERSERFLSSADVSEEEVGVHGAVGWWVVAGGRRPSTLRLTNWFTNSIYSIYLILRIKLFLLYSFINL